MRTSVEISDALLSRARQVMKKRDVTLRHLVEEGLRRVLDEQAAPRGFRLPDARFSGKVGFLPGAGPESIAAALREINEPRVPR
jgi:hypothetical protein